MTPSKKKDQATPSKKKNQTTPKATTKSARITGTKLMAAKNVDSEKKKSN